MALEGVEIAGQSDFSTTHRFYLAVQTDLIDWAKAATRATIDGDFDTRADFGQKGVDDGSGK